MSAEAKRTEALADAEARAKGELEAKVIAEEEAKQKAEEEAREKAEADIWTDPETGLTRIRGGHTIKNMDMSTKREKRSFRRFMTECQNRGKMG
jgi:hypothetical protein